VIGLQNSARGGYCPLPRARGRTPSSRDRQIPPKAESGEVRQRQEIRTAVEQRIEHRLFNPAENTPCCVPLSNLTNDPLGRELLMMLKSGKAADVMRVHRETKGVSTVKMYEQYTKQYCS